MDGSKPPTQRGSDEGAPSVPARVSASEEQRSDSSRPALPARSVRGASTGSCQSLGGSLLTGIVGAREQEWVSPLLERAGVRVERIVSWGQQSPAGFWYDQAEDEWVLLVAGAARLRLGSGEGVELLPGDWVDIPAHTLHRVEWTHPDVPTVWLAIFNPGSSRSP